jgi:uncharacterized surface protein with fasciclin (FAS1) repeats
MGFSLVAVLQRHIVVDEVTAAELSELSELGLAFTIQGDILVITTVGDTLTVNGATVVRADIQANVMLNAMDTHDQDTYSPTTLV